MEARVYGRAQRILALGNSEVEPVFSTQLVANHQTAFPAVGNARNVIRPVLVNRWSLPIWP
jgi:hypothetical protein